MYDHAYCQYIICIIFALLATVSIFRKECHAPLGPLQGLVSPEDLVDLLVTSQPDSPGFFGILVGYTLAKRQERRRDDVSARTPWMP